MRIAAIIIFFFVGIAVSSVCAQEQVEKRSASLGFQLNQYQKDFGMGLTITSPLFFNDKIGLRLRGNAMFNEHLYETEITWTPYANLSLGVFSVAGQVSEAIRMYGEGGLVALLPAQKFSSESVEIGGYGLFGFEFFLDGSTIYFIEIGGVGTGARADMLVTQPIYSNGLIISTGFRVHL